MAKSVVCAALKGKSDAMNELYNANKQAVYFVAQNLLSNNSMASDALQWTFKEVWGSARIMKIKTEEEFSRLAVLKVTQYCRRKLMKQDSTIFDAKPDTDFSVSGDLTGSNRYKNFADFTLSRFTTFQKAVLLLCNVFEFDSKSVAEVLSVSETTVIAAVDAQSENIAKLAQANRKTDVTLQTVVEQLKKSVTTVKVPDKAESAVNVAVKNNAKTVKKGAGSLNILAAVLSVVIVVCVTTLLLVMTFGLIGDNNNTASSNSAGTTASSGSNTNASMSSDYMKEPIIELDESKTYYATIDIANYGTIKVQLDHKAAPITVANFVNLANTGFYDGLTFHRIIDGFMMQGGDPEGNGSGGSEKNIYGEFSSNGFENNISHARGVISMARNGYDMNSASSQFFIMQSSKTHLDGDYAAFGRVVDGIEVVDAVCTSAEPTDDNGTIKADEQPIITSIKITTEDKN